MLVLPDKKQLFDLYKSAFSYFENRPWEKISKSELFGILNPETGIVGYCFLGGAQDGFSLNVCMGEEALYRYLNALFTSKKPAVDSMFDIDSLSVAFVKSSSYPKEDLKKFKGLGIKATKNTLLPCFRSFSPGMQPWLFDAPQAVFVITVMNRIAQMCMEGDSAPDLSIGEDEKITVLLPPGEGGEWAFEKRDFAPVEPEFTIITPQDDGCVKQMKKGCKTKGQWIAGIYYSPFPVSKDEDGRAVFPKIYIIADYKTGELLACEDFENIKEDGCKMVDMVAYLIQERREIPRTVFVRNDETFYVLRDVCEMFKINMKPAVRTDKTDCFWKTLLDSQDD